MVHPVHRAVCVYGRPAQRDDSQHTSFADAILEDVEFRPRRWRQGGGRSAWGADAAVQNRIYNGTLAAAICLCRRELSGDPNNDGVVDDGDFVLFKWQ